MSHRLKNFIYSQNSLNTYKSCPLKFKYKYIDNINWRFEGSGSRDYYRGLKTGSEFHLLCERYFRRIPLGEDLSPEYQSWLNKIKNNIELEEDNIYLTEYEAKMRIDENYLLAKYDLIVINPKSKCIEIWDWKTESNASVHKNIDARMQTIVYMFIAREVVQRLYDMDIPYENISMNYFWIKSDKSLTKTVYSEKRHQSNREIIEKYLQAIKNTDFEGAMRKNLNHCKYCEFNTLCNNEAVNYEIIEED